jgi:hypothetical protein
VAQLEQAQWASTIRVSSDPLQPLIEELLEFIRPTSPRSGPAGGPSGTQGGVLAASQSLAQIAEGALRLLEQLEGLRDAGTSQQAADIRELTKLVQELLDQVRPAARLPPS